MITRDRILRQDAVIQSNDKNHREFQPFGGMQGQQGRGFGLFGYGILVGDQGQVFQVAGQPAVLKLDC